MKHSLLFLFLLTTSFLWAQSDTLAAWQQLSEVKAIIAKNEGDFEKALLSLDKIEAQYAAFLGNKNTLTTCQLQMYRAKLHQLSGKYKEALIAYEANAHCLEEINATKSRRTVQALEHIAYCHYRLSNQAKADRFLQKATSLAKEVLDKNDPLWGPLNEDAGTYATDKNMPDSAMFFFQKAQQNYRINKDSLNLACSYLNMSRAIAHEPAMRMLDTSFLLYAKLKSQNNLAAVLTSIGYRYKQVGDYDRAIVNYEKGLQIAANMPTPDLSELYQINNNLGVCYRRKKDCNMADKHYNAAMKYAAPIFGKESANVADILTNMGTCQVQTGNPTEGLKYYQEALVIRKKVLPEKHPRRALNYFAMAMAYDAMGAPETAYEYSLRGTKINELLYGEQHPRIGDSYMDLATQLNILGRTDEAITYFEKAEYAFEYYPDNPQRFLLCSNPRYLLSSLGAKITTLQNKAKSTGDYDYYKKALTNALDAMDLVDFLRSSFESEGSKKVLLDEAVNESYIYQNGLYSAFKLFEKTGDQSYQEQCYAISERCKGILLQEHIAGQKAELNAGIPDSLLQQLQVLEKDIAGLEKKKFLLAEKADTDSSKMTVISDLFEKKEALERATEAVQKSNPDYVRFLKENEQPHRSEIMGALPENTALIDFHVTPAGCYAFVLEKDKQRSFIIEFEQPIKEKVSQMREGIYGYFSLPEKERNRAVYDSLNQAFCDASFHLFQTLIEPLGALPEQLLIIPSDALGYIPFEVLLCTKPVDANAFKSHNYLGDKHRIFYCPSAALFLEMQSKQAKNDALAAFAPIFKEKEGIDENAIAMQTRAALGPLAWTESEAKAVGQITGGDVYLNKRANVDFFFKSLQNAGFLHLATHAKLDDKNSDFSYLAFSGADTERDTGKVYVRELYAQKTDLQMAVLSACETGLGDLQSGEGIMSLARGFTYAGAKSVIMSLWEVNDQATADIMTDFYKNLHLGQHKNEALWNAKSAYRSAQVEDRLAHPFYWASFVAMGDMTPVEIGQDFPLGWFAALLGMFMFGWFFYKYNKERRMRL